jgi:cobalt-zinc-cadmium efflux system protein
VLAALANAVLLLAATGAVAWEAVRRFSDPAVPHGATMMWVAAAGALVNGASAWFFHQGSKTDVNVRAAFLHLLADAAVSVGVVIAGALLLWTGFRWVDPITSLLVSAVVLFGTWSLLREALHLAMDGVPPNIELGEVRAFLAGLPDVETVHDLHVWAMSTTEVALTAHLVMPWTECPPAFLASLEHELEQRFGIAHATVQIEPSGTADQGCAQRCADAG